MSTASLELGLVATGSDTTVLEPLPAEGPLVIVVVLPVPPVEPPVPPVVLV